MPPEKRNLQSKRKGYGRAFLDGYKPAILIERDNPNLHHVNDYPSYSYDENLILFFQNEELRKQYESKMKHVEKGS